VEDFMIAAGYKNFRGKGIISAGPNINLKNLQYVFGNTSWTKKALIIKYTRNISRYIIPVIKINNKPSDIII